MLSFISKGLVFCLFVLFCHCTATLPGKGNPKSGTYQKELDLKVMGAKRNYLLHIPPNLKAQEAIPLLIVLHGAFSTPKQVEEQSGFSALADRENILVAYPCGAYGLFGFFQHWNAGHCCGKAASDSTDDVGYLEKVIDDIRERFKIDTSRIYMVGFSNGGMLTYRFAAEKTNLLAAVAPLAAALGGKASSETPLWITPIPQGPLPLIIFHAKDDPSVPYEGGVSPGKGGERSYISVSESVNFWVENNHCNPEPQIEILLNGRIIKKTWSDPLGQHDIVLYLLEEWGHSWPGKFFSDRLPESDSLKGFHAADIIWDFFKSHSR